MSDIPEGLLYSAEHEYMKATDVEGEFYVGITDYAQGELGDIVFIELPATGDSFAKMDTFGTIEAVKAVSDLYCPASGEIVEVNETLEDDPAVVNGDPYGEGWMIRLRVSDPSEVDEMMDAEAYRAHVGE